MSQITGSLGTAAGVTNNGGDNRLLVSSVSRDMGLANAIEKGWAFSFADQAVTPTAAADVFCRISLTAGSDPLIITKIRAQAASAEDILVQHTANYTSATSHASGPTPANLNAAYQSSNLWSSKGDFESDVDITGDSGSVVVDDLRMAVADTDYELTFPHGIVVPVGYSLLLEAVTGGVALKYSVYGYLAQDPYVNG